MSVFCVVSDTSSSLQDSVTQIGDKDDDEDSEDEESFKIAEVDVSHPTVAPR